MSELDEEKRIRLSIQVRLWTTMITAGTEHVWTVLCFRWRFSAWRNTWGNEPAPPSSGIPSSSAGQADEGRDGDVWSHSEELQHGRVLQGLFQFYGCSSALCCQETCFISFWSPNLYQMFSFVWFLHDFYLTQQKLIWRFCHILNGLFAFWCQIKLRNTFNSLRLNK